MHNDSEGISLLRHAVKQGPEYVKLFIQYNANVKQKGEGGDTPLHWAFWDNQFEVVRQLLEAGANPIAKDLKGVSPLEWAIKLSGANVHRNDTWLCEKTFREVLQPRRF